MGKYKSYIFLGFTLLVILIIMTFVIKSNDRNKKKDEKKEVKTEQTIKETDLPISPEQNENQEVKQPTAKTKTTVNNVEQKLPVVQPTPKTIKTPEVEIDLKVNDNNNNVNWNPLLADDGISLSLIFERNGQVVENTDVSNQSSYTYIPGAEGDLKTTKVTLKVNGHVKAIGKNTIKTRAFTCTVH